MILVRRIVVMFWTMIVRLKAKQVGTDLRVNRKSLINRNTYLGNNVNFNGMTIKGRGKVEIGDNFHSGQDCLILTENHNFDNGTRIPYDNTYDVKNVRIEDNVWIGDRVILLPGSYIEEGSIIQAGSVVCGRVPYCTIAGGHPAKPFKTRKMEHYEKLKQEKMFW